MKSNNETYMNQITEKYNHEKYYLKCEVEELKNKFQQAKSKKEDIEKLYEDTFSKFEKSKEKLKEKENLYCKAILDKNELEKKFEGNNFKVYLITID